MNIAMIGAACVLGFSAVGSSLGAAIAGQAAIGSWKRSYMNNKQASFLLVAFAGAPLTQTIYGFIIMNRMLSSSKDPTSHLRGRNHVGHRHGMVCPRAGPGCRRRLRRLR